MLEQDLISDNEVKKQVITLIDKFFKEKIQKNYRKDTINSCFENGSEFINTFIKDTMNIEMTTTESKNVITSKKCAKYEVFKILNRIYYDDCLSLNRKNKVAQEIRKEIYNELF